MNHTAYSDLWLSADFFLQSCMHMINPNFCTFRFLLLPVPSLLMINLICGYYRVCTHRRSLIHLLIFLPDLMQYCCCLVVSRNATSVSESRYYPKAGKSGNVRRTKSEVLCVSEIPKDLAPSKEFGDGKQY